MTKTEELREHDVVVKNDIKKATDESPRPHANGCVGCRRAGVCIKCGSPSLLSNGRCLSGACQKCCPVVHKHIGNDPTKVAETIQGPA